MTAPRLAGLAVDVADHPTAAARLFALLGLHAVALDEVAELRCDTGSVVQLLHRTGAQPRIGLTVRVHGLADAARALDGHCIPWDVQAPNTIRLSRSGIVIDAAEATELHHPPGLTAATMYVSDVAATARFYSALGLPVTDAAAGDMDPADPTEPAAEAAIGGVTLQLRAAGLGPVTMTHTVLRVPDPIASAEGLIGIGCGFEIQRGGAVVTRDPNGGGVRLVGPRSTPA